MSMIIQPATSRHAKPIAYVQKQVWPDENSNLQRIRAVLRDDTHMTLVALVNHQVVGFVDAFETTSNSGVLRWEIDLLAVNPAFQGRGLGKQLTLAATQAGKKRKRTLARGLVAIDNIASQRTFASCGYKSDQVEHGLYIYTEAKAPSHPTLRENSSLLLSGEGLGRVERAGMPVRARSISVSTLRYQGLWVEESWTTEQLKLAQQLKEHTQQDVVGAVIPSYEAESIENVLDAGFSLVGYYHWWRLKY